MQTIDIETRQFNFESQICETLEKQIQELMQQMQIPEVTADDKVRTEYCIHCQKYNDCLY